MILVRPRDLSSRSGFPVQNIGAPVVGAVLFRGSLPPRLPLSSGTRAITRYSVPRTLEITCPPGPDQRRCRSLYGVHQAGEQGFDAVFRLPAVEAETKGANPFVGFEFLHGVAKFLFAAQLSSQTRNCRTSMESPEVFRDFLCAIENVIGGKNIAIFIFRCAWPILVPRRDLGGRIKKPCCHWQNYRVGNLAEDAVTFSVAVGPGGIEEVAAQVHG